MCGNQAFKFRAQAIFSLLEKKHPLVYTIWVRVFLWVLKESIYNKNLIPRAVLQILYRLAQKKVNLFDLF
jgi:hypothetical protein